MLNAGSYELTTIVLAAHLRGSSLLVPESRITPNHVHPCLPCLVLRRHRGVERRHE